VAETSRNGGFPQLLIEPVDFMTMYRQQIADEGRAPN
jgi:preprotein translocase subunit SecB